MIIAPTGLSSSLNGLSVGAWKASRFTSASKFPTNGQSIPASPDVTGTVSGGTFSLTTPTDEDYNWAVYDGSNKIQYHGLSRFTPPQYQARQDFSGPGAPPAAFKPPDGSTWASTTSQAAGSRLYIIWGGVWTATSA